MAQPVKGELVVGRHEHGRIARWPAHRVQSRLHGVVHAPDVEPDFDRAEMIGSLKVGGYLRHRSDGSVEITLDPPGSFMSFRPRWSGSGSRWLAS